MDFEGFNRLGGEVVKSSDSKNGEYYAFIPNELPNQLVLDNQLVNLMAEASYKIGSLNSIVKMLPNPQLIIKPYADREAVSSSRIEGTQSSMDDLLKADAAENKIQGGDARQKPERKRSEEDLHEILNYRASLKFGVEAIKGGKIDLALLKSLHKILLTNVRGKDKSPGEIRSKQNWIGAPDYGIQYARYVPPPPSEVERLLENLLAYLNDETDGINPLMKMAIIHYQFEAIHPFYDGNGRIGRLMIILFLVKRSILSVPALYISEYFERNKSLYNDLLLSTSKSGDFGPWIAFFLNGVKMQADDASSTAMSIIEYHNRTRGDLETKRASAVVMRIFEDLFRRPYTTIGRARELINSTYPTAKRSVLKLVEYGVLTQLSTKRKNNKLFAANEIMKRAYRRNQG
ncbi:MAG: Fic family protein [Candidatus Micrarchaeota archaeon]|nr:Fic family protein [Candidatus Micrarchaeota archaeon]